MFYAILATGVLLGLFLGLTVYRCIRPEAPNATLLARQLDALSEDSPAESPQRDVALPEHASAGR